MISTSFCFVFQPVSSDLSKWIKNIQEDALVCINIKLAFIITRPQEIKHDLFKRESYP
jgi:hypothetical protein